MTEVLAPPVGEVLTAETVKLLVKGDVLKVVAMCSGGPARGSQVAFDHFDDDSVWLGPDEDDDDGWVYDRFTFLARPSLVAPTVQVEGQDLGSISTQEAEIPTESAFNDDVDREWQRLCEKDDRTSPAEYPDHCLISRDELADAMRREQP